MALDLIVTVDTMAAHIAGAMGAPGYVLLPASADWRWPQVAAENLFQEQLYPTLKQLRVKTTWRNLLEELKGTINGNS